MPARPLDILLVEDNPGDIRFTQEVLKDIPIRHHLHVAKDGLEALAFLRHDPPYLGTPRPDLILLDLNLPRKAGLDMLADIKSIDSLKPIPVVILTTSETHRDINDSFELSADSYLTKPVDSERLGVVFASLNLHD